MTESNTLDATNDGSFFNDPKLESGMVLNKRYELLTEIGRGGMGVVWKAHDRIGERTVVLKFVPCELNNFEGAIDQVKASFQLVRDLHHQHICPVYILEADEDFGYYIVMQWLDGETLDKYVTRMVGHQKPLPFAEVQRILRPVAEALDHAHGHKIKIIHRDIKPSNIFLELDHAKKIRDVQVIDFGIADEIKESLTRHTQHTFNKSGTRPYMASEQWQGEKQTATTDQYALGVVAYELLSGHVPFQGSDQYQLGFAVLNVPPKPIAGQPEHVNAALQKALAKDGTGRFASCCEFIDALVTPGTVVPDKKMPETTSSVPMVIGCFLLCLIFLFAVLAWVTGPVTSSRPAVSSKNAETCYNRGNVFFDKGEYDLAITDYTAAIRLKPDYADAYNNRGAAYCAKDGYNLAIADCTEAIRLKPDYAEAYSNRGNAYCAKNDYDLAIADCNEAIRLKSDYAEAYNNRGNAYCAKGEYDRAIADCNEAIRLKPDYAEAYNNRGNVYYDKGEYDLAIADCTAAIRLKPDYADAYSNRSLAYQKKGESEKAKSDRQMHEKLKGQ